VHGLDLGRQRLRPLQILLRRLVTAHRGQRQAQLRQQPQHGERRLGVRLRRQPLLVQEQRPLVVRNGRLFLVHLPVHVAQQLVHFRPGRRVPRQPELFGRQLQRLHRGFPLVQRQQRPRPPAVNLPAQGVIGGRAFVQRLLIQLQRLVVLALALQHVGRGQVPLRFRGRRRGVVFVVEEIAYGTVEALRKNAQAFQRRAGLVFFNLTDKAFRKLFAGQLGLRHAQLQSQRPNFFAQRHAALRHRLHLFSYIVTVFVRK